MANPLDFLNLPTLDASSVANDSSITKFFNNIGNLLVYIAVPLAFIGILYLGFKIITSAGNPDEIAKAKKGLLYIFTGILLIVASPVIFSLFRSIIKGP